MRLDYPKGKIFLDYRCQKSKVKNVVQLKTLALRL